LLELLGHRIPALNALGFFAAGAETILMIWLTVDRHGSADAACHHGVAGWLIRLGELFSGPTSLILRFLGLAPVAGICFLIGALVSRFGWLAAGKVSGRDPESVFAAQL
jgi:hypothetical protein